MISWVTGIIATLGYPGILGLMFLENLYPPIPSEVIMPLAGFTVAEGELNLILVILAGTIGAILGTLIWYYVGHFLGKERVEKFIDRYGKWLTISRRDIERADYWFDHHAYRAVFFGRLIPGIRTVISLPAGISGMKFLPFLLATAIGSLVWTAFLTLAGYFLRNNWPTVGVYVGYVVPALVAIIIIWYLYRLATWQRIERMHPPRKDR